MYKIYKSMSIQRHRIESKKIMPYKMQANFQFARL